MMGAARRAFPALVVLFVVTGTCAAGACGAGCRRHHAVTVRAVDAETGLAIWDARVCTDEATLSDSERHGEAGACRRLGPSGVGEVRVWEEYPSAARIHVTADGYLKESVSAPGWDLREPGQLELTARLYREPAPAVRIVLPPGYRGLVKVGHPWLADAPSDYPTGQRLFSVDATGGGPGKVSWLKWSPLLVRRWDALATESVYAEFADGTALPTTRGPLLPDAVVLYYLCTYGARDAEGRPARVHLFLRGHGGRGVGV